MVLAARNGIFRLTQGFYRWLGIASKREAELEVGRAPCAGVVASSLALVALGARVLLLGYERIITKELTQGRTSVGAAFLFFSIGAVLWSPALLWTGLPEGRVALVALAGSTLYAVAFMLYVGALARSEASIVGPLYHTAILVVMLLAFVLLDEGVTPVRVTGGVLLLYGASLLRRTDRPLAILASYGALLRDRGAVMMVVGSVFLGMGRIVDKWVISGFSTELDGVAPTLAYGLVQNVFIALWMFATLLALGQLRATGALFRERTGRAIGAGAVNFTAYVFLLVAFTGIDVSVAEPASALSMLVTILLAGLLLGEPWKERLPGGIVMVAGAWLLFL